MGDKNSQYKPLVVNRAELDPFTTIQAGHGTAKDRDRATLQLREEHIKLHDAVERGFFQLANAVEQLDRRERAAREWHARPWWRRWFRRRPAQESIQIAPQQPQQPAQRPDDAPPNADTTQGSNASAEPN